MTNDELRKRAAGLLHKAREIKHPLLPGEVKNQIVGAAVLLAAIVERVTNE